jgi:hypothetical protein
VAVVKMYDSEEHNATIIWVLVTVKVDSRSMVLFTVVMEMILSETSVPPRSTGHHIPEADILHSRIRETVKSCGMYPDSYCRIQLHHYHAAKVELQEYSL